MGLLDGDLAQQIYEGFRGKLLTGIIRQEAIPSSGALDSYGDPIDAQDVDTAIEGFSAAYNDAFRARAGIPEQDVKVCIFANSCPGITPSKDDKVRIDRAGVSTWFQLRKVGIDPAKAMWVCQSFEIAEPA